ncbi:MAG: Stp1/IreP family PP2C-type Ser/Thr phosphatase [Bacteroidales bacterium]|nr:Stp1/IreP family PP2C-type Ser/Thr phosphatase [Bacteroidales bacterium]
MSITTINTNNVFKKDVIGNVRVAQEDSHDMAALTPNGDLFVVCDGMGGHVGGKQASSIAVKCITEYIKEEERVNPIEALIAAIKYANVQIYGYAQTHTELRGMGTTVCALLLKDNEAYIAHVGDSRIYLYLGKEKQLHRITKDHSYVQTLVDAGEITDDEAESHPNKNRILRALGIRSDVTVTAASLTPKNGDVFLICSDGLNGMINDSIIENTLKEDISITEKGEKLIKLALDAGGHDNITVELIKIDNSPHSKSSFISYNPKTSKGKRTSNKQNNNKSKSLFKYIIIALSIFLLLGVTYIIYPFIIEKDIEEYKKELQEKTKDKDSLEDNIASLEKSNLNEITKHSQEKFKNDLKSLEKEIDEINSKIESSEEILKKWYSFLSSKDNKDIENNKSE